MTMFAFITKGKNLRKSLDYDFSLCKKTGKTRAILIGGTLQGTPRQASKQAAPLCGLRPEIANPVWRTSLNADPRDGILSSEKWLAICNDFIIGMGLDPTKAAWMAVQHTDHWDDLVPRDHGHLTILRQQPDGSLFNISNDVFRAKKVTEMLELKYGLQKHNREPAERRAPTVAQTSAKKRTGKMTSKETIQKYVDEVFSEAKNDLTFEKMQEKLLEKGIEIRDSKTQKGRLQGFSYLDQKSGVAIAGSKLGSDYSLGLLARGLKYNQKDEIEQKLFNSKIPPLLKPMILPGLYAPKETQTHAAHQTEVILDALKFNNQVVNLPIGNASKVLLLIGGLMAQVSAYLVSRLIEFLRRLLGAFGFEMRESKLQESVHAEPKAPVLYYEVIQPTKPDSQAAEQKCAEELLKVAQAIKTNNPELLPIVDGEEAAMARAQVVAAMTEQEDLSGIATVSEADPGLGFTGDDFSPSASPTVTPKTDLIDELKAALLVHEEAAKQVRYAQAKKGPIHFSMTNKIEAELKLVREELHIAREKWQQYYIDFPFKRKFPSAEKNQLLAEVAKSEREEKNVVSALRKAEAEDARIDKIYAALPPAIVPESVTQAEAHARRDIKTARESIQSEALQLINALKNDPVHAAKAMKIEGEIKESFKNFLETGLITADNFSGLKTRMDNLRILERQHQAVKEAADFVYDDSKVSHHKPIIDEQKIK